MKKILSISHYDLDGFGCQLSIKEKFKDSNITFSNCGYNGVENVLEKYNFNDYDIVFITDLNFTKEQQLILYNKLKGYKGKCIYIDHHQYEFNDYLIKAKELGLKLIIDESKSATLKTYEVLKLNNQNLKNLCDLIDVYDMWRVENPKFKASNYFNTWFWNHPESFRTRMQANNYSLNSIKDELKELTIKVKKFFKNSNLFYHSDGILIAYTYDYCNHIEEFYPFKFAIITNTQTRISIRDSLNLKNEMIKIAEKYNGTCGGHENAYGMSIPNLQKHYKDIIKDIVKTVLK